MRSFQTLESTGTQTVVAAISDVAGNVGFATNSATMSVITNAQYLSDSAGCLTNIAYTGTEDFSSSVSLEWDERYRLTSVDGASSLVSYTYDVMGRRASRTENSDTVYFIYDGQQVAADLDGSGNALRSYVWGAGIDNLLCFTDHTSSNTYYAIKDHQNSVLAFVDSNGAVAESYEYDAWGRTRVFGANGDELTESALGNRYCFQGREVDWITGFYYFRARWYDPVSGRWLSKDPIGISGGLNLYVFCGNNPVNVVDPHGEYGLAGSVVGGISGFVSGAISGYASGGWAGAAAGAVTGGAAGAIVGAVNPFAGAAVGGAVGGAVGSAIGQYATTGAVNPGAVAGAALSGAAGGVIGAMSGGTLTGPAAAVGTAAGNIVGSAGTSLLPNAGENLWDSLTGNSKEE